ncbi:hypothetical protein BRC2024_KCUCJSVR_CDS_0190 [Acinetobacter phage vB_AbaM_KissB]
MVIEFNQDVNAPLCLQTCLDQIQYLTGFTPVGGIGQIGFGKNPWTTLIFKVEKYSYDDNLPVRRIIEAIAEGMKRVYGVKSVEISELQSRTYGKVEKFYED